MVQNLWLFPSFVTLPVLKMLEFRPPQDGRRTVHRWPSGKTVLS